MVVSRRLLHFTVSVANKQPGIIGKKRTLLPETGYMSTYHPWTDGTYRLILQWIPGLLLGLFPVGQTWKTSKASEADA